MALLSRGSLPEVPSAIFCFYTDTSCKLWHLGSFTTVCVCARACMRVQLPYRGGGNFARGEFRGENFAVKKGGEIFPWRNFGVTVPSFTTAAGIVFREQGQAQLRTRLCQPFAAQMHESDNRVSGVGAVGFFFKASTVLNGDVGLPLSSASSTLKGGRQVNDCRSGRNIINTFGFGYNILLTA